MEAAVFLLTIPDALFANFAVILSAVSVSFIFKNKINSTQNHKKSGFMQATPAEDTFFSNTILYGPQVVSETQKYRQKDEKEISDQENRYVISKARKCASWGIMK